MRQNACAPGNAGVGKLKHISKGINALFRNLQGNIMPFSSIIAAQYD